MALLLLADSVVPVQGNTATVNVDAGHVTISWTYPGDESIPVRVQIVVRELTTSNVVYNRTVPVTPSSLVVPLSMFSPSTSYRVFFTAMNLLGSASTRENTFILPSEAQFVIIVSLFASMLVSETCLLRLGKKWPQ